MPAAPTKNPPPLDSHQHSREHRVHGLETRFLGRRPALEFLYEGIRGVVADRCETILTVTGAAGMGKSRLVGEFLAGAGLETRGVRLLKTDSMPAEGAHSLRFTDQILRQRFGIPPKTDAAVAREAMRLGLRGILAPAHIEDAVNLFAYQLRLPMAQGSRVAVSAASPAFQTRALATLVNLLAYDASRRPLLLVVDSYHHAPTRTRDALRSVATGLQQTAALVLVLSQKPIERGSFGPIQARGLRLPPLSDETQTAILRHLVRRTAALPEALIQTTVERAKGNPQLLEELVRLMLQRGILVDEGEAWSFHPERLQAAALPGTTGGVARARVTELGSRERQVAEMAAAFGPVFWFGGVLALMRAQRGPKDLMDLSVWLQDKTQARLNATLLEMQRNDLVEFRQDAGLPNEIALAFANPVERQKLYAGIPAKQRRAYHRVAAAYLSRVAPAEDGPLREMIAWHHDCAGDSRLAGLAYRAAAQAARTKSQTRRASELYQKAVERLDAAVMGPRCESLLESAEVLAVLGQYAAADRCLVELLFDARVMDDLGLGGRGWLGRGRLALVRSDYSLAAEYLQAARTLLERAGDSSGVADCLDDTGRLHSYRGAHGGLEKARACLKHALALRRECGDKAGVAQSLSNIGNLHLLVGNGQRAADCFREALEIRRRQGEQGGVALTLVGVGATYFQSGQVRAAEAAWRDGMGIAGTLGDRELLAVFQNNLGELCVRDGRLDEAGDLLDAAVASTREIGDRRTLADALRNRAVLAQRRNQDDRASAFVEESIALATEINARQVLGHALCTRGELLGATSKACRESIKTLQRSMAIFEDMGHTPGVVRAMESCAVQLGRAGNPEAAATLRARARTLAETAAQSAGPDS